MQIESLTIITVQGVKIWEVGNNIFKIEEKDLHIQGDPFMHYVGYDESGNMKFKIFGLSPVEVVYKSTTP